jgi:hypothetical protein
VQRQGGDRRTALRARRAADPAAAAVAPRASARRRRRVGPRVRRQGQGQARDAHRPAGLARVRRHRRAAAVPRRPPSRTKWTRLVPPSVLTGHVSLTSRPAPPRPHRPRRAGQHTAVPRRPPRDARGRAQESRGAPAVAPRHQAPLPGGPSAPALSSSRVMTRRNASLLCAHNPPPRHGTPAAAPDGARWVAGPLAALDAARLACRTRALQGSRTALRARARVARTLRLGRLGLARGGERGRGTRRGANSNKFTNLYSDARPPEACQRPRTLTGRATPASRSRCTAG